MHDFASASALPLFEKCLPAILVLGAESGDQKYFSPAASSLWGLPLSQSAPSLQARQGLPAGHSLAAEAAIGISGNLSERQSFLGTLLTPKLTAVLLDCIQEQLEGGVQEPHTSGFALLTAASAERPPELGDFHEALAPRLLTDRATQTDDAHTGLQLPLPPQQAPGPRPQQGQAAAEVARAAGLAARMAVADPPASAAFPHITGSTVSASGARQLAQAAPSLHPLIDRLSLTPEESEALRNGLDLGPNFFIADELGPAPEYPLLRAGGPTMIDAVMLPPAPRHQRRPLPAAARPLWAPPAGPSPGHAAPPAQGLAREARANRHFPDLGLQRPTDDGRAAPPAARNHRGSGILFADRAHHGVEDSARPGGGRTATPGHHGAPSSGLGPGAGGGSTVGPTHVGPRRLAPPRARAVPVLSALRGGPSRPQVAAGPQESVGGGSTSASRLHGEQVVGVNEVPRAFESSSSSSSDNGGLGEEEEVGPDGLGPEHLAALLDTETSPFSPHSLGSSYGDSLQPPSPPPEDEQGPEPGSSQQGQREQQQPHPATEPQQRQHGRDPDGQQPPQLQDLVPAGGPGPERLRALGSNRAAAADGGASGSGRRGGAHKSVMRRLSTHSRVQKLLQTYPPSEHAARPSSAPSCGARPPWAGPESDGAWRRQAGAGSGPSDAALALKADSGGRWFQVHLRLVMRGRLTQPGLQRAGTPSDHQVAPASSPSGAGAAAASSTGAAAASSTGAPAALCSGGAAVPGAQAHTRGGCGGAGPGPEPSEPCGPPELEPAEPPQPARPSEPLLVLTAFEVDGILRRTKALEAELAERDAHRERLEVLLARQHKVLESMFPRQAIEHMYRTIASQENGPLSSRPATASGPRSRTTSPRQSISPSAPAEQDSGCAGISTGGANNVATGNNAASAPGAAGDGGSRVSQAAEPGAAAASATTTKAAEAAAAAGGTQPPNSHGTSFGRRSFGSVAAAAPLASTHKRVTVVFADIVGFTPMCNSLEPQQVMAFLNGLFTRFDGLCDIYGVYKVETIGDCFMAVGGLITVDEEGFKAVRQDGEEDGLHATKAMSFAKAIQLEARSIKMPHDGRPLQLRVGLHSGPVTAGIVGSKMPRFCLFGDTVNTASRMESTCEPGAIHASAATAALLPDEAWKPTGGVQVKGKGEMQTFLWRLPLPAASDVTSKENPTSVSLGTGLRGVASRALGAANTGRAGASGTGAALGALWSSSSTV